MNQGVTRERRAIELGLHPDAGWADISLAAERRAIKLGLHPDTSWADIKLAAYKKRQDEKHPGFWSRLARFLFG